MNQISEKKDEKKKVPPPALPTQLKREKEEKVYPVMSLEEICAIAEAKCGKVFVAERHGQQEECHNHVIILPEAWEELRVMITYGRISPINEFEQQFCGYGHIFLTEEGYVTTVVSHFIQVHTMNRTPISSSYLSRDGTSNPGLDFLVYYRDEYVKNEAKYNRNDRKYMVDPYLKYGHSEYVLEGHTHPGLGVFFSAPDRATGEAHAKDTPLCTFVCDPVRREMRAAIGRTFAPAEVIVYENKRIYDGDIQKKITPEKHVTTEEEKLHEVYSIRKVWSILLSRWFK